MCLGLEMGPDGTDRGETGRVGTDSEGMYLLKEGTGQGPETGPVGMGLGGTGQGGRALSLDEVGPRMAEERATLRVTQGTIEGMTETGEAADETLFPHNTDPCCNKLIPTFIEMFSKRLYLVFDHCIFFPIKVSKNSNLLREKNEKMKKEIP
jgi:hypothetical protein